MFAISPSPRHGAAPQQRSQPPACRSNGTAATVAPRAKAQRCDSENAPAAPGTTASTAKMSARSTARWRDGAATLRMPSESSPTCGNAPLALRPTSQRLQGAWMRRCDGMLTSAAPRVTARQWRNGATAIPCAAVQAAL